MRASRLILALVALSAVVGGLVAAHVVSAHTPPQLGGPVVVRPAGSSAADPHDADARAPRHRTKSPGKAAPPANQSGVGTAPAEPVNPRVPAAGEGDDDASEPSDSDDRDDRGDHDDRGEHEDADDPDEASDGDD